MRYDIWRSSWLSQFCMICALVWVDEWTGLSQTGNIELSHDRKPFKNTGIQCLSKKKTAIHIVVRMHVVFYKRERERVKRKTGFLLVFLIEQLFSYPLRRFWRGGDGAHSLTSWHWISVSVPYRRLTMALSCDANPPCFISNNNKIGREHEVLERKFEIAKKSQRE